VNTTRYLLSILFCLLLIIAHAFESNESFRFHAKIIILQDLDAQPVYVLQTDSAATLVDIELSKVKEHMDNEDWFNLSNYFNRTQPDNELLQSYLDQEELRITSIETIKNIYFGKNKATLRGDEKKKLGTLISVLKNIPKLHFGRLGYASANEDEQDVIRVQREALFDETVTLAGISKDRMITMEIEALPAEADQLNRHEKDRRLQVNVSVKKANPEEQPVAEKQPTQSKLTFKVMLGAFEVYKDQEYKELNGAGEVIREDLDDGLTIYYRQTSDHMKALEMRDQARDAGIEDALIYYYLNDDFVPHDQLEQIEDQLSAVPE